MKSAALVAVTIASLLTAAPARAQKAEVIAMRKQLANPASDERAVVAAVTTFLGGIRARDTTLIRSTVVAGATVVAESSAYTSAWTIVTASPSRWCDFTRNSSAGAHVPVWQCAGVPIM